MILLRKIIFYLFAIIFAVCSPILILYSLGYWFGPEVSEGIIKTGLIYVSSVPRGASLTLNGKKVEEKTPALLRDLVPGVYKLRLAHRDHEVLERDVYVKAGKASVLDKLILVPERDHVKVLALNKFENILTTGDKSRLLLTAGDRASEYWVYERKTEKMRRLFEGISPAVSPDEKVDEFYSAPDSPFLMFELKNKERQRFLGFDIKDDRSVSEELSALFIEKPSFISWSPDEERYLFAYRNGFLSRVDVELSTIKPQIIKNVWGYGFWKKDIYVLTRNGIFLRSGIEGTHPRILMNDRMFFQKVLGEEDFFKILFLSKQIILFWGSNGKLVGNKLPYDYVESGILGVRMNEKKKKILVHQKERIGVLNFSAREGGAENNEIFERGPAVRWVFEKGDDIRQLFWLYEDSHVLFLDGDDVYLLNLMGPETAIPRHVLEVKHDSLIAYAEDTGKIYFLSPKTGYLSTMEILPTDEISFLAIPDLEVLEANKEAQEHGI